MEHLRLEKYQDIMLISSDDFEVGNATYLNILVKDINNLEKHITSQFIVEQLEENHGTLKNDYKRLRRSLINTFTFKYN